MSEFRRYQFSHGGHNERADFVLATDHEIVCAENERLKREVTALRQHKNDFMAAAEESRRALNSDIDLLRPKIGQLIAQVEAFQPRVRPWLLACFGEVIADDEIERNHRFLEESLELVQACGCTKEEAINLVSYVFGRPTGEQAQEVGGVMVTLAALCLSHKLDMHHAGEVELARISNPEVMERIRWKQANKPAMSALPGAYPERVQSPQA